MLCCVPTYVYAYKTNERKPQRKILYECKMNEEMKNI